MPPSEGLGHRLSQSCTSAELIASTLPSSVHFYTQGDLNRRSSAAGMPSEPVPSHITELLNALPQDRIHLTSLVDPRRTERMHDYWRSATSSHTSVPRTRAIPPPSLEADDPPFVTETDEPNLQGHHEHLALTEGHLTHLFRGLDHGLLGAHEPRSVPLSTSTDAPLTSSMPQVDATAKQTEGDQPWQAEIPGWAPGQVPDAPCMTFPEGVQAPSTVFEHAAAIHGTDRMSTAVRDHVLRYAHTLYARWASSQKPEVPTTRPPTTTPKVRAPPPSLMLALLYQLYQMDPTHIPTLLILSCTYFLAGNLRASLWYSNAILRLDPHYIEAMSNIGCALRGLGHWQEAEQWWWRALHLSPGYWDVFENLLDALCHPVASTSDMPGRDPQWDMALRLCDFVDAHIMLVRRPMRASAAASDASGRIQIGLNAGTYEPQALPPSWSLAVVPRVQHLFFAKGNLTYALPGHAPAAAVDAYLRALEVVLSSRGQPSFTLRDLVVAVVVFGMLTHGSVVSGQAPGPVHHAMADALGIDLRHPAEAQAVTEGRYLLLHSQGLLGLVHAAGDRLVRVLLEAGGGTLPTVLFLPEQISSMAEVLWAKTDGTFPVFTTLQDPLAKSTALRTQVAHMSATILLVLAKVFQDTLTASTAPVHQDLSLRGLPLSTSLLLVLHYLSLAWHMRAPTCNNLGILLSSLPVTTSVVAREGERVTLYGPPLALRYYALGLQLDPRHSHLYTNLGSLLKDMGRLPEAIAMYERAVSLHPTLDVALANLASAIKDQGRPQDAIPYYQRLVHLHPHFPEGLCGLVHAMLCVCDWRMVYPPSGSGWMNRAVATVARQLQVGSKYGRGLLRLQANLDTWLDMIVRMLGDDRSHVRELWRKKLEPFFAPHTLAEWVNEGGFLLRLVERLMRISQWRWYHDKYKRGEATESHRYDRLALPSSLMQPAATSVLPFHTFTYPLSPRQVRLISHRTALRTTYSALSQPWLPRHVLPPPPPPVEKLHIGYVSSDFNNHPLAHLMQSVFSLHDRHRFTIFCYATSPSDATSYRQKIERDAHHFLDVSAWTSERIIRRVHQDQIHILVNLNGYTKGARNDIFAPRPCPVQMQFMGFAGGLVSGWTDWLVVDPIVCPPALTASEQWRKASYEPSPTDLGADLDPEGEHDDWVYSERMFYMPHSFFVNDHAQGFREPDIALLEPTDEDASSDDAATRWRHEEIRRWRMRKAIFPALADDMVIFANFNQLYKVDPALFRAWLEILRHVPRSILWLLRFPCSAEEHLRRDAEEFGGFDVASRIVFSDVADKHLHIYRGRVVDLFLDTVECNAHTTAVDVLWSGTPVLTWPKHMHKLCSRVAASLLHAVHLEKQLVVHTIEAYVDRAVALATSLAYRYMTRTPAAQKAEEEAYAYTDAAPPTAHDASGMPPSQQPVYCTSDAIINSLVIPDESPIFFRTGTGELLDIRRSLFLSRDHSPLFNTRGWTRCLEAGYEEAWRRWEAGTDREDSPEYDALPSDAPEKQSSHIWLPPYSM